MKMKDATFYVVSKDGELEKVNGFSFKEQGQKFHLFTRDESVCLADPKTGFLLAQAPEPELVAEKPISKAKAKTLAHPKLVERAFRMLALLGAPDSGDYRLHEASFKAYVAAREMISQSMSLVTREFSPGDYRVIVNIGDTSNSHYKYVERVAFQTTYPARLLCRAYRHSCQKTGRQFHYGGDGMHKQILSVPGDSEIGPHDVKALREYGLLSAAFMEQHDLLENDDGKVYGFCAGDVAELIMHFIRLSMPGGFQFREVMESVGECLNDTMDFGLGLFS